MCDRFRHAYRRSSTSNACCLVQIKGDQMKSAGARRLVRRRDFIVTFASAVAAKPLSGRAQPSERMRHVGLLTHLSADDQQLQIRVAAFVQGLQQSGWTVGRNLRIAFRWAAGNAANIPEFAAELTALS